MTEDSWDNIAKLLAAGDQKAYETVFREFFRPLVGYACRLVGDRSTAEDIVQEFFCRLWEERASLAEVHSCRTYFYRSVRNRCMNFLRDRRMTSLEELEKQPEGDFWAEVLEEEVYRELYAAINRLPDKCRAIFNLKLEGAENDEIAAKLGISEATVRSQLRRGRELLRQALGDMMGVGVWAFLWEMDKFC